MKKEEDVGSRVLKTQHKREVKIVPRRMVNGKHKLRPLYRTIGPD